LALTRYIGDGKKPFGVIEFTYYAKVETSILPDGTHGSPSMTSIPLPSLTPPTSSLVAVLSVPPQAKLHSPIPLTLIIRNPHLTKAANVTIQLELEASDGFIVAGLRGGRIPILLPGAEERVVWKIIPIECGHVKIPRIRVVDRRATVNASQQAGQREAGVDGSERPRGETVNIVDVRLDLNDQTTASKESSGERMARNDSEITTVFVLPP
jgi:trafficking protein particle complex subunit 11